jgi:uncharacterized protein DUF1592/uncharacterized protein DUF1588/uncharacterized protein DUF1595/uncharacterized protein DUF1585/uncharacterized protein DUF1587
MGAARKRRAGVGLVAALALGLGLGACTGLIGDGGTDGSGCVGCTPETTAAAELETTRFPRLSHLQWENTVRDLLRLPDVPGTSQTFGGDPLGGIFDNNEAVLLVTPNLWADYQAAAESLSVLVADDATRLAAIMPANLPSDPTEKARAFLVDFGKRAYRRPLSDAELATYEALFAEGPTLVDGTDDFAKGVKITLQAFLQSPHFLYRVESSAEIAADELIHLSGWEVATKLSYMLWNTMPDDILFDAAESGALGTPEGIMTQAERLLADDRARPMVAAFHAQLYQYDHYEDLYKDPAIFPDFTAELGEDMKTEAEMFVDDVVFSGGGLEELLTAPFTYVNDGLAPLYGLPGPFGPDFVRVDLDPTQRAGFLTRIGFLASNATPKEQNTIHRGIFVNMRILCNEVPAPPDNVPPLPPAENFDTNRERVEGHTGVGTCGENCHHVLINPPGYALEHYDAVGAYQELEKGHEIDASADYHLDGEAVSFDGAIEMSEMIADTEQAHRCYAKHWLEFAYGRLVQDGDTPTLDALGEASRGGSVQSLMLALTQTVAFRTRAPAKEVSP